jgi:hypothetical protein
MDLSHHIRLSSAELTPAMITGAVIYGVDDEKVGTVDHIDGAGMDSTAIVDVGGFLGIGAKPVALPIHELDFMRDEHGEVHAMTSWTKDELKELPEHPRH